MSTRDGNFIIIATIAEIVDEKSWWYTACTCLKDVNFDRGYPFCSHCTRIVFDMSLRYKLKVLDIDGDEAAHFIVFDSECTLLLNKSCQELIDEQELTHLPMHILKCYSTSLEERFCFE